MEMTVWKWLCGNGCGLDWGPLKINSIEYFSQDPGSDIFLVMHTILLTCELGQVFA